jgi:hypothetical protein
MSNLHCDQRLCPICRDLVEGYEETLAAFRDSLRVYRELVAELTTQRNDLMAVSIEAVEAMRDAACDIALSEFAIRIPSVD